MAQTQGEEELYRNWQEKWNGSAKGRWTYRLLPNIKCWVTRDHGVLTKYQLTQFLNCHGCFAHYLWKRKRTKSGRCMYCQDEQDDTEHTIFKCPMWEHKRKEAELRIDEKLSPYNIVRLILWNQKDWRIIANLIINIITEKENHERETYNLIVVF